MSQTPASETVLSCKNCGATIYPEHLDRHMAGYWAGALYCACCLTEKKDGKPPAPKPQETAVPLEEVSHGPSSAPPTAATPPAPAQQFHRLPPRPDAKGASRIRIFHARMSDGAVGHLDQQVNEWLDRHPEIELKFATTTVGTWEGKHAEPNLILTVFY